MPCPTWNPPAQSSPSRAERVLALVDDADLPAGSSELERDGAADAAATDDENLHAVSVAQAVSGAAPRRARAAGRRRPAPRTAPGGARSRPSARRTATAAASGATSRARSDRRPSRGPGRRSPARSRGPGSLSRLHLDAELGAERARLLERGRGPASASAMRRVDRAGRAARSTTWSASTVAPCSAASLTAVATISSPITPSFIGTRIAPEAAARRRSGPCRARSPARSAPRRATRRTRDEDDEADQRARRARRTARRGGSRAR